jgi:hypothetical protein
LFVSGPENLKFGTSYTIDAPQELQVRGLVDEGLVFVLPVNVHQVAARIAQLSQRDRPAVDESARAAAALRVAAEGRPVGCSR